MDVNTAEPLDTLTPLARKAISELGSSCTTVSGVIRSRDPAVFSAIAQGLERANQKATSNAQKVTLSESHTFIGCSSTTERMIHCENLATGSKMDTVGCRLFSSRRRVRYVL